MNNSKLLPCPLCGALLDLHGPIYGNKKDLLNDIHVCRNCGLVHKPFLNYNDKISTDNVYSVSSWKTGEDVHLLRMKNLVRLAEQRIPLEADSAILDVGAGIGLLYDALSSRGKVTKYIALEPVASIAAQLKSRHPSVHVLNSAIDRAEIPGDLFNLVFVLGVDYLFQDIGSAFRKIQHSLKSGGHVVIQRNVFIDQTAYVGKKIETLEDMFGSNLLMRNWFHSGQYPEFLNKYFVINDTVKEEFEFSGKSSHRFSMFQYTYFCQMRGDNSELANSKPPTSNYFDVNMSIVNHLSRQLHK
jgi:trans-aconitate methyltransferase